MNTTSVTPPNRPLKHAAPLQVQRNKAARVTVQPPTSASPSPMPPRAAPQQMPALTPPRAPVQATSPVPPAPPPIRNGGLQFEPTAAQRADAAPEAPPAAPFAPWRPVPYHAQYAQLLPSTPYDAMPPPALFVHALPTSMEPHNVGPVYLTPNGMLEYYAYSDANGHTKIVMTSWASSMQHLYRELGCTLPRYRETQAPNPNPKTNSNS